jgi:hypothetical protein
MLESKLQGSAAAAAAGAAIEKVLDVTKMTTPRVLAGMACQTPKLIYMFTLKT